MRWVLPRRSTGSPTLGIVVIWLTYSHGLRSLRPRSNGSRRRSDGGAQIVDVSVPNPFLRSLLHVLTDHAAAQGGVLHVASGPSARERLIALLALSAELQCQQPGYTAELVRWASRYAQSGDGIQAVSVPSGIGHPGEVPMRWFPHAALPQSPHSFEHDDASALMILASPSDDLLDVLRAGEPASVVLLAATGLGLSTTLLSQPLEVAQTSATISRELGYNLCPQLVLRVGWPQPGASELPPTPRRRLTHVTRSNQ